MCLSRDEDGVRIDAGGREEGRRRRRRDVRERGTRSSTSRRKRVLVRMLDISARISQLI